MFITFEGIDGCGKSTQVKRLQTFLEQRQKEFVVTREPGGTKIGLEIRRLLMDPDNVELSDEAEILLYMADRMQHLKECIVPALQSGKIVLCDRYHDSTIAYQGGGRGLNLNWLTPLQEKWIQSPDCTFWFDLSPEIANARLEERYQGNTEETKTRLEMEPLHFYQRIRQTFQEIHDTNPERVVRINAEESIEDVHSHVVSVLKERFGQSLD